MMIVVGLSEGMGEAGEETRMRINDIEMHSRYSGAGITRYAESC
jgi:hypothetical protein